MATEFELATAVTRTGEGVYTASIASDWDIGGNANGGYVIAMAARAMADAAGRPPLTVTAHYLTPGQAGPCTIDVDVVRVGGRTSTVRALLRSGDIGVAALLGSFGDQVVRDAAIIDGGPPDLPPIDECLPSKPPNVVSGFSDRVDARVRPSDLGFGVGEHSGRGEIAGWFRLDGHDRGDPGADEATVDAFGLLLAADAFAPVCFQFPEFEPGHAPTLELTVHVRGTPEPGPLRCRFTSRFLQHGLFEEDGELWDSAGRLVAQSRQLALIPRPAG
jgi:hypothetical protein